MHPEGPIADQVKSVKSAVERKVNSHYDDIFKEIVRSNVPGWVRSMIPAEEFEAKKNKIIAERMEKVVARDADVVTALQMKPNTFEIVPIK